MNDLALDTETVDRLLTTTRSFRRRLDTSRPVEPSVIEECLQLAVHAPSADNRQAWRWLVISDAAVRRKIASLYGFAWRTHSLATARAESSRQRRRGLGDGQAIRASSRWLAENLADVPMLVIPCMVGRPPSTETIDDVQATWVTRFDPLIGRPDVSVALDDAPGGGGRRVRPGPLLSSLYFGSIFPAIWSFALALRSRGLGTVITSTHLSFEGDVAKLLGIPSIVTQLALMPVAYLRAGPLTPSRRVPARERTYWNQWEVGRESTSSPSRSQ